MPIAKLVKAYDRAKSVRLKTFISSLLKGIDMTDKSQDIITATSNVDIIDNKHDEFKKRMLRLNAVACSAKIENLDIQQAEIESQEGLRALNATGGLQEMLSAQMLSIHRLQQISMGAVSNTFHPNNKHYFTNTAIKLANIFVQQANLLAKLQGNGGQKIIVEHVDIHNGGRAIVGNVTGVSHNK